MYGMHRGIGNSLRCDGTVDNYLRLRSRSRKYLLPPRRHAGGVQTRFCESNVGRVHLIQPFLPLFSRTRRRGRFAKQRSCGTRANILSSRSLCLCPFFPFAEYSYTAEVAVSFRIQREEKRLRDNAAEDRKGSSFASPLSGITFL